MIIWGSRGVSKTVAQGMFYCPQCSEERRYEHKRARRFFTLYFIPLIPMGDLGEFVECGVCNGTFVPSVLASDPREGLRRVRSEIVDALCAILGHVAAADGPIQDAQIASVLTTLRTEFGADENDNLLDSKIRRGVQDEKLTDALASAASHLTESGKESVMRVSALIARTGSNGPMTHRQVELLRQVGEGLKMSSAHLRGMMAELNEQAAT